MGRQPPPMNQITDALKKPSTYVIFALGVIAAFAYARFFGPLRTVASKLPGSQA